jgi:TonB family protein
LLKALGIGGHATQEVIRIVEQRGVTFELTSADEAELREAGADLKLIEAIRNNCRAPVTQAWLLDALSAHGRDAAEIVRQVELRGVTFHSNEEIEARLRVRGATQTIIEAARKKYRGPLDYKELEAMLRLTQQRPPRMALSDVVGEMKDRGVGFKLTGRDTIALKKAGASDEVIAAALDNDRSYELVANPHLPVPTIKGVDPMLFPPEPHKIPYGDPKSSAQPSSGPGTGSGMGQGGGMGTGEGTGIGPGRGGNTGGADPNFGGGGPGNTGPPDYTRPFRQNQVTKKAAILSKPDPVYTEEARKNQVSGVVHLRAVLNSNGTVTNISVVKGLPNGLTERAIAAARQIKFRPAEKDGRVVSQYVIIEYNFNIY